MSLTSLANFASMRGFGMVGVPNGFCGGIALLGANRHRPSVNNEGYTLSPAGAAKLYAFLRSHDYNDPYQGSRPMCDPNGAMNIWGVNAGLKAIASGTPILVDYDAFSKNGLAAFHSMLRSTAGVKPIIVEWNFGQALTTDEPTLHRHFTTIGAIDTERPIEGEIGGYGTCDDDSSLNLWPARANPPIWHTFGTLENAQPMAYIIGAA